MSDWQGVDSCLEVLETDSEALYHKAQGGQDSKNKDQALPDFKKAQEMAPEDRAIQAELLGIKQKIKARKI